MTDITTPTRRSTLLWCAVALARAGGPTGALQSPASLQVVRRSTAAITPDQAKWLDEAYKNLREAQSGENLAAHQAIHEHDCVGKPEQNVHDSIRFLYWHRAFLMYHQEQLFKSVPADKREFVVLPYWEWSKTKSLSFPCAYSDPDRYPNLFRERRPRAGQGDLSRQAYFDIANRDLRDAWGLSHFEQSNVIELLFRPTLESAHNFMHDAVGENFGLKTSPLDPLFYCFHAEIDRVWMSWAARAGVDSSMSKESVDKLKVAVFGKSSKPLYWYGDAGNLDYKYDAPYSANAPNDAFELVSADAPTPQGMEKPGIRLKRQRFFFVPKGRHIIRIRLGPRALPIGTYDLLFKGRSGGEFRGGPVLALSEGKKDSEYIISSRDALRGLDDRYFTASLKNRAAEGSPEIELLPSEVQIYRVHRRHR